MINTEEIIQITALHADDTAYRWWESKVEYASSNCIVTLNKIGDLVYEPKGYWEMKFNSRSYYWTDLPYNLLETYTSSGEPEEIYINIASPFRLDNKKCSYYDYELDVNKKKGHLTEILDEEEFLIAINQYRYSTVFVNECRSSLESAIILAERWTWSNDFNNLRELHPDG